MKRKKCSDSCQWTNGANVYQAAYCGFDVCTKCKRIRMRCWPMSKYGRRKKGSKPYYVYS